MIVDFDVCGLLDFHEGNFSADCYDKMLTLLSLFDSSGRLAAAIVVLWGSIIVSDGNDVT